MYKIYRIMLRKNIAKLLTLIAFTAAMGSCSSQKNNLEYFTDIDARQTLATAQARAFRIEVDDELKIVVSSEQPSATAHYNLPMTSIATKNTIQSNVQAQLQTYLVDGNGDINFPVLGNIHVAGLTLNELREYLEKEISKDVNNPHVTVQQLGFRIVMLGEFNNPGTKHIGKEQYTILDAIGDASDLTKYAQRENLLLIRHEGDQTKSYRIDLTKSDFINEPYFYLKQDDVLYAVPNKIVVDNSKYNTNNGYKLSVISTIVSAASIVASLVIALTVKR